MVRPESIAAVIPCLNEGATIAALVREVRQYLAAVIVVDDGSTDNTAARAWSAGAVVVGHGKNLGKGAALKTGFSAALKGEFEWALAMDGDGQHKPEDLPAFSLCAAQTGARLVVGNRMHNAQAIPWLRRQINRWMSRRISERTGQYVPDSQCGFRLVHLRGWASLRLETSHFETESEMLVAFARGGYPIRFVPIQVVGRGPRSHIRPVQDTCRWLQWWSTSQPGLSASLLSATQRSAHYLLARGGLAETPCDVWSRLSRIKPLRPHLHRG